MHMFSLDEKKDEMRKCDYNGAQNECILTNLFTCLTINCNQVETVSFLTFPKHISGLISECKHLPLTSKRKIERKRNANIEKKENGKAKEQSKKEKKNQANNKEKKQKKKKRPRKVKKEKRSTQQI